MSLQPMPESCDWQSHFAKKHRDEARTEGRIEGRAEALLMVLRARGLLVETKHEEQIRACGNVAQLDRWLQRAAAVSSLDELCAAEQPPEADQDATEENEYPLHPLLKGYEWQSDFAKHHRAVGRTIGRAEGRAEALLIVLFSRGLYLADEHEEWIREHGTLEQLDRWLRRAAAVSSLDELFEGLATGSAEELAKGRAEGRAEGLAKGRAEGRAEAVLTVLRARRVSVDAAHEEQIRACGSSDQLDRWLQRVAAASSLEELFAE